MIKQRSRTCWIAAFATFAAAHMLPAGSAIGEDEPKPSALSALLQSSAEHLSIEAADPDANRLALQPAPLMTYSDPARGYSAAAVWRIGKTGRPQGLLAIEFWPGVEASRGSLSYELLSFRDGQLSFSSPTGIDVELSANAIDWRTVPDTSDPSRTEAIRLRQMKRIASRIRVTETLEGEPYSLRALPRPIDRYEDTEEDIVDGAAFVFVYGTNPELLVLIECDQDTWRYGLARMSSAQLQIWLDDDLVSEFPELTLPFPTQDYQAASHRADLPLDSDDTRAENKETMQ